MAWKKHVPQPQMPPCRLETMTWPFLNPQRHCKMTCKTVLWFIWIHSVIRSRFNCNLITISKIIKLKLTLTDQLQNKVYPSHRIFWSRVQQPLGKVYGEQAFPMFLENVTVIWHTGPKNKKLNYISMYFM